MSELEDSQNANETSDNQATSSASTAEPGQQSEDAALLAAEVGPPTAQDTPKFSENQEKPANATARTSDTLELKLRRRQQAIDGLLREKEALQLSYVTSKTPKAYYLSWKAECNRILLLDVSLRQRMRRLSGKS
ncbi:MAG: hypothetical protein RL011_697 [Pseudomonadota bacterium]|jgi:hypothetical protein